MASFLVALIGVTLFACEKDGLPAKTSGVDVRCVGDIGLSEQDSAVIDWAGQPRRWASRIESDQIIVSLTGICGDECSFAHEVVLSEIDAECPTLESARTSRALRGGPLGTSRDTTWAKQGTLEIQDWDLNRTISGRLDSEVDLIFYVDMSEGSR